RETLPRQHPPPLQRRRASRLAPRRGLANSPAPEDPPHSPRPPDPPPAHSASGGCGPRRRHLTSAPFPRALPDARYPASPVAAPAQRPASFLAPPIPYPILAPS